MAQQIYAYIMQCIEWLPKSWIALIIGCMGLAAAEGVVGIIDRAWRIIGR